MITLAQLFQDLEAAVVQQEPAVTQIEQRGEEVTDHVAKANTELDGAVKKARAARRKKWYCAGIVGMYSLDSICARTDIFSAHYHHCRGGGRCGCGSYKTLEVQRYSEHIKFDDLLPSHSTKTTGNFGSSTTRNRWGSESATPLCTSQVIEESGIALVEELEKPCVCESFHLFHFCYQKIALASHSCEALAT